MSGFSLKDLILNIQLTIESISVSIYQNHVDANSGLIQQSKILSLLFSTNEIADFNWSKNVDWFLIKISDHDIMIVSFSLTHDFNIL